MRKRKEGGVAGATYLYTHYSTFIIYVLHPWRRQEQRQRRRSRCWPWISSLIPIVFAACAHSFIATQLWDAIYSRSRDLFVSKNEKERREKRRKTEKKRTAEVSLTPAREHGPDVKAKEKRALHLGESEFRRLLNVKCLRNHFQKRNEI